ncbi:hypothetical protein WJX72_002230 [[Myrmecia] bisecta]|uniref:ATP-binding cassette transporter n=1 Tax=[Myrmecia] bisecta TaxID=41462 RepID=A0AAW1PNF0_9CHLO
MSKDTTPLLTEVLGVTIEHPNGNNQKSSVEGTPNHSLAQVFPKWLKVARLWFEGDERWLARGYALACVCLSLGTTTLLVRISYAQRNFETAMAGKDTVGFYKAVWEFVMIICIAAPLFALNDWVEARLVMEWRRWLTRQLLIGYFSNRAFFKLHQQLDTVDNPDQRICDDVPAFTDSSVMLCLGMMRKLFNCIAFAGVLYTVAPKLVLFLMAYSVFGTWFTASAFGKRLMRLSYRQLQNEGNLRFDLVRTRENAESIAFYSGEAREAAIATSRLILLINTLRLKLAWEAGLAIWTNCYSYATILVPSLLTAPRYFSGEVEFGVITQVGFAFHRIESALSMVVNNLSKFSGLAAETERLDSLFAALRNRGTEQLRIVRLPSPSAGLSLQSLTLLTPGGGQTLCRDLDLGLAPGQSLLIVGPSGCGKSSLLRAIAGLWTDGSGIINCPMPVDMFFLPQKPFMPLGNLRQQLLFPSGEGTRELGSRRELSVSDLELQSLLEEVRLPALAERVGGFGAELEWAHVLSLGEQQRVAMLRLLLHRPGLAFLDEATGALDTATEAALYAALRRSCRSYISVGHRMQLLEYHTHVLENVGGSHWKFYTADQFAGQAKDRK